MLEDIGGICLFMLYIFIEISLILLVFKVSDIVKRKKSINNKRLAIQIIDDFEQLLDQKNIKIPNIDRKGNEDEACIYGSDYYNLEDSIIEILSR